ncbi:MAG: hypothetical protein O3A19_11865, partial [Planctomycetota bacterium]|nr:hypothetical protein [Planctomycetota bacterium]
MKDSFRFLVLFSLASFLVACTSGGKNTDSESAGEHDADVTQVIDSGDGNSVDIGVVDSASDGDTGADGEAHAEGAGGDSDADAEAAAEAAAAEAAAA